MRLDPFELTAVDIAGVDLESLHALSVGVGWPHRADDWRLLIDLGQGVAALDEIGRVLGSAMWFPQAEAFATGGMVITSPRLQARGAGAWLTGAVLAAAGDRPIGLNATRAATRLYHGLGFRAERPVFQHQGEVGPAPGDGGLASGTLPAGAMPQGTLSRDAEPADLPALVALDAAAFGAARPAVLRRLLALSQGRVLVRDGRVEAFALRRPFGRGAVIGPVVASADADAIAVTRPLLAPAEGGFLRLDTRQAEGDFPSFLSRRGLALHDRVETMSRGGPWLRPGRPGAAPTTYALASQALG
jgi:GNAT superfamily N-acetyltransferase